MQSFAVIPAAGVSARMGEPKLLLPWRGAPLIQHTLSAWSRSDVSQSIVVVRPEDQPLAGVCRKRGAHVVQPAIAPTEMKVSVQRAIEFIDEHFAPQPHDVWLLAPADMPHLSPPVINALLMHAARQTTPLILAPVIGDRQGHPVLFPWSLACEVTVLGENEGVNALLKHHPVERIDVSSLVGGDVFTDVDTPEDYQRLSSESD